MAPRVCLPHNESNHAHQQILSTIIEEEKGQVRAGLLKMFNEENIQVGTESKLWYTSHRCVSCGVDCEAGGTSDC